MIIHFKREEALYINIIQIIWIFLIIEGMEFLHLIGMYEPSTDTYHNRKIFWSLIGFLSLMCFIGLITLTCCIFIGKTLLNANINFN